jgi:hypothetical protein
VQFRRGLGNFELVDILGPPIHRDTIARPLSAEAQAVLEAAVKFSNPGGPDAPLYAAAYAYARSIAPPDPLADARKAADELHTLIHPGDVPGASGALSRLFAALGKLEEKKP